MTPSRTPSAVAAAGIMLVSAVFGLSMPVVAEEAAPTTTPAPLILVVDRNAVMRQSLAGKDIIAQVEAYGKQMETEFGPEEASIRADAQAFQQQASVLDAKVRDQKQKSLRDRQAELQRKVQERQAQIQAGVNKARQQIAITLEPILKELMIARGANLLIERQTIILGAIDVDITQFAIQRLDQVLPKVPVELVAVPTAGDGGGAFTTPESPDIMTPAPAPAVPAAAAGGGEIVTVKGEFANMRAQPSTDGALVQKVAGGTQLRVFARENGWAQVGGDSPAGWIREDLLAAAQ